MDISSTNDGDENHECHEGIASSAIKNMGIFVSRGVLKTVKHDGDINTTKHGRHFCNKNGGFNQKRC